MVYSGGRFKRWENLDGNRTIAVPPGDVSVSDRMDVPSDEASAAVVSKPEPEATPQSVPAAVADDDGGDDDGGSDDGGAAPAAEWPATGPGRPRAAHRRPASGTGAASGDRSRSRSVSGTHSGTGESKGRHHARPVLAPGDGVTICCLRLPARVRRDASTGKWTAAWDLEHLLARKRASFADTLRVVYVGLAVSDEPIEEADQAAVEAALSGFSCCPVFVPPATRLQFERGFCRDTLWGVMHNVVDVFGRRPTRWWSRDAQEDRWQAYSTVNHLFTDRVVQLYSPGDLVWVHGHQLLLMPQLVTRRIRMASASVGLFVHAPFPSSEIFRSLSCRQDILRGMLLAGQVGFHLYEYARHFSTSCRRILSLHETDDNPEHDRGHPGSQTIEYQGRRVSLAVSHAGIEPTVFGRHVRSAAAVRECAQLRAVLVDRDPDALARCRKTLPAPLPHPSSAEVEAAEALSWGAIVRSDDPPLLASILALIPDPAAAPPESASLAMPEAGDSRVGAPAWGPLPRASGRPAAALPPGAVPTAMHSTDGSRPWEDGSRRLAVGVETLSRLDGIPLKLLAWEVMLRRCPQWVGRVTLVQVCIQDDEAPDESAAVLLEARHIVARTNAAFSAGTDGRSFPAVVLVHRSSPIPARSRAALFAAADVLVALPLRAGFAPAPLEYVWAAAPDGSGGYAPAGADATRVVAHDGSRPLPPQLDTAPGGRPGVAVLSEFVGCSRVLNGALRVNPWKVDEVVAALAIALGMPGSERVARWESSASFVGSCSTTDWAERVLLDLKRSALAAGSRAVVPMGFGYHYRAVDFGRSFRKLRVDQVLGAFRRARRRVIFTDYGGTLHTLARSVAAKGQARLPAALGRDDAPTLTPETKSALRQLSADPRTVVFVISGKERQVLERAFVDLPDVGIAAEHGFFYRWPVKLSGGATTGQPGRWHRLLGRFDDSWLGLAFAIMELYTARTNGTFILRKGSAIAWHFGDADAEFGSMQAKELKDHLAGVLGTMPVEVVSGLHYVEVRPKGVTKGVIALHILRRLERVLGGPPVTGSAGDATPSTAAPSSAGFGRVPTAAAPPKAPSRGIFGALPGPLPSTPMSVSTAVGSDDGRAAAATPAGAEALAAAARPEAAAPLSTKRRPGSSGDVLASLAGAKRLHGAGSIMPHAAAAAASGAAGAGMGPDDGHVLGLPFLPQLRADSPSSPYVEALGTPVVGSGTPLTSPLLNPRPSIAAVDDAAAAAAALHRHSVDFVLGAGDDTSDELLFAALNEWKRARTHDRAAGPAVAMRGKTGVANPSQGSLASSGGSSRDHTLMGRGGGTGARSGAGDGGRHRHYHHHHAKHKPGAKRGHGRSGTHHGETRGSPSRARSGNEEAEEEESHRNSPPFTFTVTVGQKPSRAHTFVDDPQAIEDLFLALGRFSARAARNRSMVELRTTAAGRHRSAGWSAAQGSPLQSASGRGGDVPGGLELGAPAHRDRTSPMSSTGWAASGGKRRDSGASSESSSSLHRAAIEGALLPGTRFGADSSLALALGLNSSPPFQPSSPPTAPPGRVPSVVDISLGLLPAPAAPAASRPSSASAGSPAISSGAATAQSPAGPGPPGAGSGSDAGISWLASVAQSAGLEALPGATAGGGGPTTSVRQRAEPGRSMLGSSSMAALPRHGRPRADGSSGPAGHDSGMPRSISGSLKQYFRTVEDHHGDQAPEF